MQPKDEKVEHSQETFDDTIYPTNGIRFPLLSGPSGRLEVNLKREHFEPIELHKDLPQLYYSSIIGIFGGEHYLST